MKKNLFFILTMAAFCTLFSAFAFAQDDKVVSAAGDMYVISAKAGGINHLEGKVAVARKDGKSGYLLKEDTLEIGDKITTGSDGRAEILLNPGSFVRLAGNSSFEFISTNLDDLKLKLSAGSVILEVYADDEFKVSVALPNSDLVLTRSGVYRIDVLADGNGKISVWKGKVYLGDEVEVKSGRAAILSGKNVTSLEKFDRDNKDEFVTWSQLRAKEAAKINSRLQRNALSNTLVNSFNRGYWNMYNTFGLWVLDPLTRRWCFLPFGYGWSSPWGYDYGFDLWRCRLPRYVYDQPPPVRTNPNPNTNPNGGGVVQNPTNAERRSRLQTPTFRRFEDNQQGGTASRGGGSSQSDGDSNQSSTKNRNTRRSDGNGNWESPRKSEPNWDNPRRSEPTYVPPPRAPEPTTKPIFVPSSPKTKDN